MSPALGCDLRLVLCLTSGREDRHLLDHRVLTLLTWRIGTFLLCGFSALVGRFPFVAPFAELPVAQREMVLQSWATSSMAKFRKASFGASICYCLHLTHCSI